MKSFFLITLGIISIFFVQAANAQPKNKIKAKSESYNRAPARNELQAMFGQPISCHQPSETCLDQTGKPSTCVEPENIICFEAMTFSRKIIVKVEFNRSSYAKMITVFDGTDSSAATETAKQIIMLNGRGKFLKKSGDSLSGDCHYDYQEEYQYLTMNYAGISCINASPGGVTINWKE